jgi:hypothetical protein
MGDEGGMAGAAAPDSMATGPNGPTIDTGIPSQITVGGLRFPLPKVFDASKEADFENFAYKLRSFLSLANPTFRKLMKESQEATENIDFDLFDDKEQRLSVQMQHALTSLTDGSAAKIVMKDDECDNGFESWRQLYLRYGQTPKHRAHSRMSVILQWKFRENNFENEFND